MVARRLAKRIERRSTVATRTALEHELMRLELRLDSEQDDAERSKLDARLEVIRNAIAWREITEASNDG